MKHFMALMLVVFIGQMSIVRAQNTSSNKVVLSGYVKDHWTGEGVIGANVYIKSLGKGTVTDENGFYELSIPKGRFVVRYSRIDLNEEIRDIDLIKDVKMDVYMREKVTSLNEVVVSSERQDANIKDLDVGKNVLKIERINELPALMGEVDVVKSLVLLPGVSTVGEGSSGFNVRGGSVDQNLILQDGAIVFNPSHVFGFFSAFNPNTVDKVTLYKSGIPVQYSGRLSSVLDVQLKEGDLQEYHIDAGAGLVSSKLVLNGPILKNKLSFLIGGRVSYSDFLLGLAKNPDVKKSSAEFQDYNAKLTYLSGKDKLTYSGYLSNDGFNFSGDTRFDWQTMNHVLNWSHNFNDDLFVSTDVVSGNYNYTIKNFDDEASSTIESVIDYYTFRSNWKYSGIEKHELGIGIEANYFDFTPGNQTPLGEISGVETKTLESERSIESGIYIEDEYKITEDLSVRAGVRYNYFVNFGEGTDYLYTPGETRANENIIDTLTYTSGDIIANYDGFEPRINLNWVLDEKSSIKASYNRNIQFLHLISNTSSVTPTDIWKTSNKYIQPEFGNQFSLGYFRNFKNNRIETSVEVYYKTAENVIDFKDGTSLLMNDNIEADLINGKSEAYGMELYLNKKYGALTGWVSYTFSRSFRQFDNLNIAETINGGKKFPSNYDKPHDFTFALSYKTSPIVIWGANFTYSTGRPNTVPLAIYDIDNLTGVFSFSERNHDRIPDYHRLDVSVTVKSKPRIDRKWDLDWIISIYNLYGRRNAYSIFYENQYGSPPQAYKLSVLGSAFPSIMLNFKY